MIDHQTILSVLSNEAFAALSNINVLPLIYDEDKWTFNIMIFDVRKAFESVTAITYVSSGSGRKHPTYRFDASTLPHLHHEHGTGPPRLAGLSV